MLVGVQRIGTPKVYHQVWDWPFWLRMRKKPPHHLPLSHTPSCPSNLDGSFGKGRLSGVTKERSGRNETSPGWGAVLRRQFQIVRLGSTDRHTKILCHLQVHASSFIHHAAWQAPQQWHCAAEPEATVRLSCSFYAV
jgi:hypothetical protein